MQKESFLAEFEYIEKNDFNLNIPRYLDNFEIEEEIDLKALLSDMEQTEKEINRIRGGFVSLMKDLTSPDESINQTLNDLIKMIEG